jgi:hypothetical protein
LCLDRHSADHFAESAEASTQEHRSVCPRLKTRHILEVGIGNDRFNAVVMIEYVWLTVEVGKCRPGERD